MRWEEGDVPEGYMNFWEWLAQQNNRLTIPLALRLDKDAAARQMIEECWWG